MAPKWFDKLYTTHGKAFAAFIHNKPLIKAAIRPLFELFVFLAEQEFRMVEE